MKKIPFIITIDTEGDDLWSQPEVIGTTNTKGLHRFQELCNKYSFKPVYLTNYEMAMDGGFVEFGEHYSCRGQCEIGMHLHAWNSPPEYDLTGDDMHQQPFLFEYPESVIDSKVRFMTELLRSRFTAPIVSHRAGRWGMSPAYYNILGKYGYTVDCSVTPGVDWSGVKGKKDGNGGTDYYRSPNHHYFVDNTSGNRILEVPVTIEGFPRKKFFSPFDAVKYRLPKLMYRVMFRNRWLRPSLNNLDEMKLLVDKKVGADCKYLEFMIHSSELSAGLNPTFKTDEDIEKLYYMLEELFSHISAYAEGTTLNEFYKGTVSSER